MSEVLTPVIDSDLKSLTLKELKARLKALDQKVSGNKAELIDRLYCSMSDNLSPPSSHEPKSGVIEESKVDEGLNAERELNVGEDLNSLTVAELKVMMKARDLKILGKKADMIEALQDSMGIHPEPAINQGLKSATEAQATVQEALMPATLEEALEELCKKQTQSLEAELAVERAEFEKRQMRWPLSRLVEEGYAIIGLQAFQSREASIIKFSPETLGAQLPFHKFKNGDLALVKIDNAEGPGAWEAEGMITDRTPKVLSVKLPAAPPMEQKDLRYRLDFVCNGVSHERKMAAVEALAISGGFAKPDNWKKRFSPLQQVLAGPRQSKMSIKGLADRTPMWAGAGQAVPDPIAQRLREQSQTAAVRAAMNRTLTLWQGPPGTGKTRTICALIESILATASASGVKGPKLLATSASNVAVDNILMGLLKMPQPPSVVRVGAPARVTKSLHEHTLDELMARHPSAKKAAEIRKAASEVGGAGKDDKKLAKQKAKELEAEAKKAVLERADVILATCVGSQDAALKDFTFGLCIVDEAAQATEPDTLCALSKSHSAVLVGDPAQLPPTVLSTEAANQGLKRSLFERIASQGVEPLLLAMQFRMHPGLANFSSHAFYGGLVKSHAKTAEREHPAGLEWPSPDVPVAFVASTTQEHRAGTSYSNIGEAKIIVGLVQALLDGGSITSLDDVGIVTPYSGQVRILSDLFSKFGYSVSTEHDDEIEDAAEADYQMQLKMWSGRGPRPQREIRPHRRGSLEIRSVDGYQGREKEVIIMSAVRANDAGDVGFVADPRRLNVAITRARSGLIVVGDSTTLGKNPVWQDYLRWLEKQGLLTTPSKLAPSRDFTLAEDARTKSRHLRPSPEVSIPKTGTVLRNLKIKETLSFGVFVEVDPVHNLIGQILVRDLDTSLVIDTESHFMEGDTLDAKVIGWSEPSGRLMLSRKALMEDEGVGSDLPVANPRAPRSERIREIRGIPKGNGVRGPRHAEPDWRQQLEASGLISK